MTESIDREHLDALLQTYRRNLQILERQIAAQGGGDLASIRLINEADDARRSIAGLERQLTLLGGTIEAEAPSPYPGLMAFGREQAGSFYGRASESADLLEQVRSTPIVLVVGASGSGKSSLVLAGLLPLLDRSWRVLCLTPGARPLRALADQLATLALPEARMRLADELEDRLARRADGLASGISTLLAEQPADMRLMIVIDQLEELFTQVAGQPEEVLRQQRQLIINLKDAALVAGDRWRFVLTLRADFVGHWLNVPDIPAQPPIGQFLLRPMSELARREAIVRPAERAGALFEQGLVERLLDDTRDQPAALPLLQFTLAQLWQRRNGQLLTHAAYEEIGGVSGALDQRASAIYSQLSEPQQRLARNLFIRLVTMNEEVTYTRRRVQRDELRLANVSEADVDRLIGILSRSDVRLVATEADRVELAHEALIDHWSELRGWLEANHDRLIALRRLTETAAEWRSHGRDPSYLYRGARLADARRVARESQADLNLSEQEFFARSAAAERRRLIIRWAAATAAALVVLALMLTVWLERGPFAPTLGWETPAGLAGTEVTALDWGADGVMYAGLTNKRGSDMLMARSDDGGQHWRSLRLTGTFVASLRADPTEPRRLYVSLLQDGVYRSADAGEHWERIDQQLPLKMVDALVVAPAGALYAGAAKDGGVYTSADHGDTWSHMSGSPDDAVFGLRWLKACPGVAGECLLAGTEHGVWRWTSNGSWIHILDHGLVFDTIQLDDHIVAVGEAVFDLPAGSTVREIAREQMTTIDMITGSKPYLVLGGLKGNLWQWRPGDTQLQSLMENTSCQTTTINIVRAAPDNGEQIWVGDNNGLHHGKWRHWYELH